MNRILVIELPEEDRKALVLSLRPGSKIWFDHPISESDDGLGDRIRWFDKNSSSSWNGPEFEEYNWLFLRQQQNWANDMLRARGHLFLNEVYSALGLSHRRAGQVLGWVYTEAPKGVDPTEHPNFIDFGCWEQEKTDDGRVKLTFNAGPIFQQIDP